MTVVSKKETFVLHDPAAMRRWWSLVGEQAQTTLMTRSGTRIYVTEPFYSFARARQEDRFIEVHIVSTATGTTYEYDRQITDPPLQRLIPLADIASVAPIVDAELTVPPDPPK